MLSNLASNTMKIDIFLVIIMQLVCTIWIIQTIEQHSVHPVYAKKIENASYVCQPWDSC